jgi:hypothetical protein
MPFIVIVPGIAALAIAKMNIGYALPLKGDGYDYDQAFTTLMSHLAFAGSCTSASSVTGKATSLP